MSILLNGLMVVAGTADIGVEDRDTAGGPPLRRVAIELVVEDRAHRAVGQRADLDGAGRCRFEAIGAERPHQAHDAQAGAEPLFGMRPALQNQLAQGRRRGPDLGGFTANALDGPVANTRLIGLAGGQVRFRWKDYRHPQRPKIMALPAGEFIRRFLLHVLPNGFRRIRHFGFLANAHRSAKLAVIRGLLDLPEPESLPEPADYRERYARLFGRSLDICPACGGHLVEIAVLKRASRPEARPFSCDSS